MLGLNVVTIFGFDHRKTKWIICSFCSFLFIHAQMMCGCGSVACTQCAKGEGWRVLWNGQKAGGLSLRVKRDERVGGFGGWMGWM